jgi:hypothetical protein
MAFSPLGARQVMSEGGIWKGDLNCISVFNCNYTSIMHSFRYKQVCLLTGNDVMALSPLGSATGDLCLRVLKGRPRFNINVSLTFCVYLVPFRSYSNFYFWLWFPTGGEISKNSCIEGTSLRQTASVEPLRVKIGSRVWAVRVAKKKKQSQDPYMSPPSGVGTADRIRSKICRIGDLRNVITLAKFWVDRCIIVTLAMGWTFMFQHYWDGRH